MASDHSEEDYIDMEISSYADMELLSSNSIMRSSCSFNNPREFEFQMCSAARERDRPTTSPADELFYKGKLLPLHLPPRLQMVEKLLNSANAFSSSFDRLDYNEDASFDHDFFSTPLMTTAPTPTATSTPFESCNISPSESFRISRDINTELSAERMSESSDKKSFSKKQRNSSLGSKLKASRAYLRSFFGSSSCSSESSTAARKVADEGSAVMYEKTNKKNSLFVQIPRIRAECELPNSTKEKSSEQVVSEGRGGRHRRSFSLALRRHSTTAENKSSSSSSSSSSGSSSFSSNSKGRIRDQLTYLKRCGSANYSETESSIQGAIAHCNQSQKMFHSRNSISASIS